MSKIASLTPAFHAALLTAAVTASLAVSAFARAPLYTYGSSDKDLLYQIDLTTGDSVKIGALAGGVTNGIGLDPNSGTIFYATDIGGVRHLAKWQGTVNTDLGSLVSLAAPSTSADGDYFGGSYWYLTSATTDGFHGDDLIRVNLNNLGNVSGIVTVGSVNGGVSLGGITDVSFRDSGNNIATVYGTSANAKLFSFTVNTATNKIASTLTALSGGKTQYAGLSTDPVTGTLYGIDGVANSAGTLFTLNITTGSPTTLFTITGDASKDRISDLTGTVANAIAVPEAGSLAMVGIGACVPVLGLLRRRAKTTK